MTLSPWRTLQNVIHTQKCEPCQLNKPTTPFPAGGFPPDTASSTRPRSCKHGRSLTVMPWTTTDEFNVIPKTSTGMSLASFPGHNCTLLAMHGTLPLYPVLFQNMYMFKFNGSYSPAFEWIYVNRWSGSMLGGGAQFPYFDPWIRPCTERKKRSWVLMGRLCREVIVENNNNLQTEMQSGNLSEVRELFYGQDMHGRFLGYRISRGHILVTDHDRYFSTSNINLCNSDIECLERYEKKYFAIINNLEIFKSFLSTLSWSALLAP